MNQISLAFKEKSGRKSPKILRGGQNYRIVKLCLQQACTSCSNLALPRPSPILSVLQFVTVYSATDLTSEMEERSAREGRTEGRKEMMDDDDGDENNKDETH